MLKMAPALSELPREAAQSDPMVRSMLWWVAGATAGFLPTDLEALCREAILHFAAEPDPEPSELELESDAESDARDSAFGLQRKHFETALYHVRPSLMKNTDRFADDVAVESSFASDGNSPSSPSSSSRIDDATLSLSTGQRPEMSRRKLRRTLMSAFSKLPGLQKQHRQLVRVPTWLFGLVCFKMRTGQPSTHSFRE